VTAAGWKHLGEQMDRDQAMLRDYEGHPQGRLAEAVAVLRHPGNHDAEVAETVLSAVHDLAGHRRRPPAARFSIAGMVQGYLQYEHLSRPLSSIDWLYTKISSHSFAKPLFYFTQWLTYPQACHWWINIIYQINLYQTAKILSNVSRQRLRPTNYFFCPNQLYLTQAAVHSSAQFVEL
jgi:hypothetical protein